MHERLPLWVAFILSCNLFLYLSLLSAFFFFRGRMVYRKLDFFIGLIIVGFYYITFFDAVIQYLFCQRVFQVFLYSPVQRPCTKLRVVAFFCYILLGSWCQFQRKA